jgi:hypothetical protein
MRTKLSARAKLTWEEVGQIRNDWKARKRTQMQMAREHGVSQTTISLICRRQKVYLNRKAA